MNGNPSSAQPMRSLSKRAQALLAPTRHGFSAPIEKRYGGEIPQALRSFSPEKAHAVEGASALCTAGQPLSVGQRTEVA